MYLYRHLITYTLLLISNHVFSDIYLNAQAPKPFILSANQQTQIVLINFEDDNTTCRFNGDITLRELRDTVVRAELIQHANHINIFIGDHGTAGQIHVSITNKLSVVQEVTFDCHANESLIDTRALEAQFSKYQATLSTLPQVKSEFPTSRELDQAFDIIQTLRGLIDSIGGNLTEDIPNRLQTQHRVLEAELTRITKRWAELEEQVLNEIDEEGTDSDEDETISPSPSPTFNPPGMAPPPPPPPPADSLEASSPVTSQSSIKRTGNLTAEELGEKLAEMAELLEGATSPSSVGHDTMRRRLERYHSRAVELNDSILLTEIARLQALLPSAQPADDLMGELSSKLRKRASSRTSPPRGDVDTKSAEIHKSHSAPHRNTSPTDTTKQRLSPPPSTPLLSTDNAQAIEQAPLSNGAGGDISSELLSVLARRSSGGTIRRKSGDGSAPVSTHASPNGPTDQPKHGSGRSQTLPRPGSLGQKPTKNGRALPPPPRVSPSGTGYATLPRGFKPGGPSGQSPSPMQKKSPPSSHSMGEMPKKLNLSKAKKVSGGSGRGGLLAQINSLRK